jgi:DNA-binding transcriptional LysR family regulator
MQRSLAPVPQPLDWDDARLLLAMLRAPSLVAGARALGIDKSTASRRVDALEQKLGARLFVRTREGLRPSTIGERLRAHAERIELEMLALANAARASGDEIAGRVRIATTEGMATLLVQNGILDLDARYPGLEIELLASNRPLDLGRGEAELAIRVTPTNDPSLTVRVLGKQPVCLFASPGYLRAKGAPKTPPELAGHDVLLPSGDLDALPEAKWLREQPGVRVALRSSSLPALVEAAVRGHGLVPITRAWGETLGSLEHVLDLKGIPPRPTWLVMHPDVAMRPAVRAVADRIAEGFQTFARGK